MVEIKIDPFTKKSLSLFTQELSRKIATSSNLDTLWWRSNSLNLVTQELSRKKKLLTSSSDFACWITGEKNELSVLVKVEDGFEAPVWSTSFGCSCSEPAVVDVEDPSVRRNFAMWRKSVQ